MTHKLIKKGNVYPTNDELIIDHHMGGTWWLNKKLQNKKH